jgi:hypothetical protein
MAWRYAFGHDVVGRAGSGSDQDLTTGTPYPLMRRTVHFRARFPSVLTYSSRATGERQANLEKRGKRCLRKIMAARQPAKLLKSLSQVLERGAASNLAYNLGTCHSPELDAGNTGGPQLSAEGEELGSNPTRQAHGLSHAGSDGETNVAGAAAVNVLRLEWPVASEN